MTVQLLERPLVIGGVSDEVYSTIVEYHQS